MGNRFAFSNRTPPICISAALLATAFFSSIGCSDESVRNDLLSKLPQTANTNNSLRLLLKDGRETNSREIGFIVSSLRNHAEKSDLNQEIKNQLSEQANLLEKDRQTYPQAIKFTFSLENQMFRAKPDLKWVENIPILTQTSAPIVIVGDELGAVTSAIKSAKEGIPVILVHTKNLGGLVSDQGGNLRYFDTANESVPTAEHIEIMDRLSVPDMCSVPKGVSLTLLQYLKQTYGNKINLVEVDNFSGIQVLKSNQYGRDIVSGIVTQGGLAIYCGDMIDFTPDSLLAEKSGLPLDPRGPQLGDGVVFDVDGLTPEDLRHLGSSSVITPNEILSAFGLKISEISDEGINREIENFNRAVEENSKTIVGEHQAYGFSVFATGFNLYMACEQYKYPDNKDLKFANSLRVATGFNISTFGGSSNFNSLSYRLPYQKLQGEHNINIDSDLSFIKNVEFPGFKEYLRLVTAKSLEVRMPNELYVRRATALLVKGSAMPSPLSLSDTILSNPRGLKFMTYGNDYRAATKRDDWDKSVPGYAGWVTWRPTAEQSQTTIRNLWVIGKSGNSFDSYGAGRILMGDIKEGSSVIEYIASNR